ncbi:GAF domain-containing sensor histidine kinase [uncultured Jatrophihabitans sp.]|uniref:GAF domain-containing sensor histidine kinase n=1 Tax=uncultured Jatrophihabitans sp. TaxID=1610747 RepID=UPI0035CC9764
MRSVSDDRPSAEAALRRTLDQSAQDVENRPIDDILADVARGLVDTLDSECAAIAVWAAGGASEVFAAAGEDADAPAIFARLREAAGSLTDTDVDVIRTPPGPTTMARIVAPVLVRGRRAGAVYVAGAGGGADFDDRASSVAHSAAVGVAGLVERARTAEANRRRERWFTGGTEIARALTAAEHPDPLTMIAERAAEIADADAAMVLGPASAPGLITVEAAAGIGAQWARQQIPDLQGDHVQRVLDGGRAMRIDDLAGVTSRPDLLPLDTVMLVPMHGSTGLRGVLGLGRSRRGTFTEAELGMAGMFASTVALALELAESQSHREQTALVLERDRIARDLHDHVIQRLYAIGLTIQHVSSMAGQEIADRLLAGVTDIDAAIGQIRSTIFRLTTPILGAHASLRTRAEALVDELEPVLGYRPALVSEGPLDFGLDDDLMADCEAVLREGITNIARHARATHAEVSIAVTGDDVIITISDDGRGLGESDRRSGLGNLRRRAEQRGGGLEILLNGTVGTKLVWSVPLDLPD